MNKQTLQIGRGASMSSARGGIPSGSGGRHGPNDGFSISDRRASCSLAGTGFGIGGRDARRVRNHLGGCSLSSDPDSSRHVYSTSAFRSPRLGRGCWRVDWFRWRRGRGRRSFESSDSAGDVRDTARHDRCSCLCCPRRTARVQRSSVAVACRSQRHSGWRRPVCAPRFRWKALGTLSIQCR
jgi:hypothetical protein